MGAFYVSFLFSLSYLIAFGFMLEVYQALVLKKYGQCPTVFTCFSETVIGI